MAIFNRGNTHEPHETDRTTADPRTETHAGTTRTVDREPTMDRAERAAIARENAHERFGGINLGAGFFGWLVTVAVTVLLTSIIGAALAAIDNTNDITWSDADRQAGTIGVAAGITLMVVLAIAYFAGGYVAGRMSRFDGAKQGFGAWLVGFLVTVLALVIGGIAGQQYNVFDRVDLPRIPLPSDEVSATGILVAVALIVLTLLSSMLGGKVGTRYHLRVDRAHTV